MLVPRHAVLSVLRAAGALLALSVLASRVWAGNIEEPPPPPLTVGPSKAPSAIPLPAKPVTPAASTAQEGAAAAADGEPKDAPGAPPKAWKLLKPDELISEKSILFASVENFKKAKEEFLRSALAGLLNEEDVTKSVALTVRRLKESYIKGSGARTEFEMDRHAYEMDLAEKLFSMLDEQVALAVEAAAPAPGAAGAAAPSSHFLLALSFRPGEAGEQRHTQLGLFMDNYIDKQRGTRVTEDLPKKVGPYEIQGLHCNDLGIAESWAFVENLFLYGQGEGIVAEALKAYHERQGKGTLSQNGAYRTALAQVGEREAPPSLYVQCESKNRLRGLLHQERWLRYLALFILPGLDQDPASVALGMRVLEGESEAMLKEKLLLGVSRKTHAAACKGISAYLASADSIYYQARQSSLAEVLKPLVALTAERDPGAAAPFLAGFMPELMKALDVNNEEEVWSKLEPFSGELAVLVNYIPGENVLKNFQDVFQIVFAVEINRADLARASATLASLERAARIEYKKYTYGTAEIHYQLGAKPDEASRGGRTRALLDPYLNQLLGSRKADAFEGCPFFVSYAILEVSPPTPGEQTRQFLLLSDSLSALQKAVQQVRLFKQSLAESKPYRDLSARFLETRYAIQYLDLPRLADALYHNILPARTRSPGQSHEANRDFLKRLPSDASLARHLKPMAWASTVLNQGEQTEFVSPIGNAPLFGLIGALALPEINAEKAAEVSRLVDENFKQISLALQLYAAAYDRFPGQLSDLVPDFISFDDIRRVFSSPFAPGAVQGKGDLDETKKTNLIYRAGRSLQDISREILIYEEKPTLIFTDKGRVKSLHHVLNVDGKMRVITKANLDRWLTGQLDVGGIKEEETSAPKK